MNWGNLADVCDLSEYKPGSPQIRGALTVVPLFGPDRAGDWIAPLRDWKVFEARADADGVGVNAPKSPLTGGRLRRAREIFESRFECLTGQTGVMILRRDRPVGLEIAPTSACFAERCWPPVGFSRAMLESADEGIEAEEDRAAVSPFAAASLLDLRAQLFQERRAGQAAIEACIERALLEPMTRTEAGRVSHFRRGLITGSQFAGQYVEEILTPRSSETEVSVRPGMLSRLLGRRESPPVASESKRLIYLSLCAKP